AGTAATVADFGLPEAVQQLPDAVFRPAEAPPDFLKRPPFGPYLRHFPSPRLVRQPVAPYVLHGSTLRSSLTYPWSATVTFVSRSRTSAAASAHAFNNRLSS